MPVTYLKLENVGPLAHVEFHFDQNVNVLIGPNNSGKTTALLAFADILVKNFSVPGKLVSPHSSFRIQFDPNPNEKKEGWTGRFPLVDKVRSSSGHENIFGGLGYRVFVPAMRLGTDFRSRGPGQKVKVSDNPFQDDDFEEPISSLWSDDKQIIQKFIDLDYRAYRENRSSIRKLLDSIATFASSITESFSMQFAGIGEDKGGLFPSFKTPDGVVPMSVLSQGTQSLLQWTAQLVIGYAEYYDFPDSFAGCPGVAIIDEIDAHLHPSWQRRILPAIKHHFPDLQIICAAHSPMTLAGLDVGQIHLLSRDAKGQITVSTNKTDVLGWSADEIYSTFLGVEPTDLETSNRLERVRELRSRESDLSPKEAAELKRLRTEIQHGLSGGSITETADVLADALKKAAKTAARNSLQPGNGHKRAVSRKQPSPAKR